MQLLATLNPENALDEEVKSYPVREAARAVVVDHEGNVALLHVTRDHYYKLPGGGVESSEDRAAALQRECLEEIGCEVEVVREIGMIVENRKFCALQQISYCYLAKLRGEKGKPNFMADEVEEGFEALWVPKAQALALLQNSRAITFEGKEYIVPRDTLFMKAAE